jgi:hypothetical protein
MTTSLISRFLLWLPQPGAPTPPQLAAFAAKNHLPVLHSDGFWLAADSAGAAPWLDVPPGKRLAGRQVHGQTVAALCAAADVQMQLYTLIHWDGQTLTLCGDAGGFKPVYRAHFAGGILIATRLTDILLVDPALITPLDRVGLHSLFMLRGIYSDRTLHTQVKRLLAGTVIFWSAAEGLRENRERRIRYPAINMQMGAADLRCAAETSLATATRDRLAAMIRALCWLPPGDWVTGSIAFPLGGPGMRMCGWPNALPLRRTQTFGCFALPAMKPCARCGGAAHCMKAAPIS